MGVRAHEPRSFWPMQRLPYRLPLECHLIPGHALRKQSSKKKTCRSTGQQPRKKSASRPRDKPQMNRLFTRDFVPAFGLHKISLVRASRKTFKRRVFDAFECEGRLSPERTVLLPFTPARSRPAASPCTPTRPARCMSGLTD